MRHISKCSVSEELQLDLVLFQAKRVALYLARACPNRLLDELMTELQTVETLNCLIERTETPPFYRLTSMRKASSHSDGMQWQIIFTCHNLTVFFCILNNRTYNRSKRFSHARLGSRKRNNSYKEA